MAARLRGLRRWGVGFILLLAISGYLLASPTFVEGAPAASKAAPVAAGGQGPLTPMPPKPSHPASTAAVSTGSPNPSADPSVTNSCSSGALGHGFWNGDVCISTTPIGNGSFEMTDPARRGLSCGDINAENVALVNMDKEPLGSLLGDRFTQPNNTWGDAQPADLTTGCVDAMYAAGAEWDMLRAWLGRDGIDGQGHAAGIGVGDPTENAFFLPANAFRPGVPPDTSVILGQLGAEPTNPEQPSPASAPVDPEHRQFTPMDVVAHEFGHMVFETTPGASNSTVENAALNEGTADIMAQLTIGFANNPMVPLTYTMGAQLFPGRPFRIMYNPSLCASFGTCTFADLPDLNCYRPDLFARFGQLNAFSEIDEGGGSGLQYTFAGVLNHWFYLLAEGSNPAGFPASPTCDGSALTGLGIKTAGQIWSNALLQKTPTWKFPAARSATLTAAIKLFPGTCTEFDKVKAAWNAVSVPALPNEPTCGATPPTPPTTMPPITTPPTTMPPTTTPPTTVSPPSPSPTVPPSAVPLRATSTPAAPSATPTPVAPTETPAQVAPTETPAQAAPPSATSITPSTTPLAFTGSSVLSAFTAAVLAVLSGLLLLLLRRRAGPPG